MVISIPQCNLAHSLGINKSSAGEKSSPSQMAIRRIISIELLNNCTSVTPTNTFSSTQLLPLSTNPNRTTSPCAHLHLPSLIPFLLFSLTPVSLNPTSLFHAFTLSLPLPPPPSSPPSHSPADLLSLLCPAPQPHPPPDRQHLNTPLPHPKQHPSCPFYSLPPPPAPLPTPQIHEHLF